MGGEDSLMPRPGPRRPSITFRDRQENLDELDRTAEAAAVRFGRKVTRTDVMQARIMFARLNMLEVTLDAALIEMGGKPVTEDERGQHG